MTSRSDPSSTSADAVLGRVHRAEWGRLLSLLIARTRRLDLAEDALGEAFARAAERWPVDGVPANPAGWLATTAWRVVVGRLRAEEVAGRKAPLLAVGPGWVPPVDDDALDAADDLGDERLQLILLCCHPALPRESRSALALRLVVGTPTDEIARLFLVPVPTMAARLTRARRKIVLAGVPLVLPVRDELRARLDEVCRSVYLAFTAGYAPGAGSDLLRADLAGEAVHLARVLHGLVPEAEQVRALLALLLLQHARRDARTCEGRLVTLAEQDRSAWHRDELAEAMALVARLEPLDGYAEELRLQASIAVEHGRAATAADTDWPAIARHYGELERRTGSPVVRLNRAVAVAEADGPRAGLSLLTGLDDALASSHRLPAVRAELARRAGDVRLAAASYREAIERCGNETERRFLTEQLAGLDAGP